MATAISPVIEGMEQDEITAPGPSPEYNPIPALCADPYMLVTRWKLDEAELKRVMETGEVWLQVWTGGEPLQPVLVSGLPPVL
jgi:hypothetical protein